MPIPPTTAVELGDDWPPLETLAAASWRSRIRARRSFSRAVKSSADLSRLEGDEHAAIVQERYADNAAALARENETVRDLLILGRIA